MKKVISIMLLVVASLMLSACGNKEVISEKEKDVPKSNDVVIESDSKSEVVEQEEEKGEEENKSSEKKEPESSTPAHVHSFSAATCTSPQKCSCGATNGSALGHRWQEATCKSPKKCSVCGVTEGSVGTHKYVSGVCAYCGNKQIISPKDGLKLNADYYYVSDKGDGDFLLYIYRFSNDTLSPRMVYSTNIEWKDGDETINYNGKVCYQIAFGSILPSYTLTDTEIIVKYPDAEYRFTVNYAYDLVVTYSSGNLFKQGTILDLVE